MGENVCIYGDSKRSYVVAIVCPDRAALARLADKLGKDSKMDIDQLVADKDLVGAVLRELVQQGKKGHLQKFELPGALHLCVEGWTPDSGLVTAAFKLKRRPSQDFHLHFISTKFRAFDVNPTVSYAIMVLLVLSFVIILNIYFFINCFIKRRNKQKVHFKK